MNSMSQNSAPLIVIREYFIAFHEFFFFCEEESVIVETLADGSEFSRRP